MAMKQPKVPEYRGSEGTEAYIRTLILFLKDFCGEAWTANRMQENALESISRKLDGIQAEIEGYSNQAASENREAGDEKLSTES